MNNKVSLIAGLGNPGPEYTKTRHNAGFWFLDALATMPFKAQTKLRAELCSWQHQDQTILLLKPTTFMNHSGQAIAACAKYYKINPKEILVVHDELDLAPGTIRYKLGGGHGGHNGLRDIIGHLGRDFQRLRLGIGHPGVGRDVSGFVLSQVSKAEQESIDASIAKALTELNFIIDGAADKFMQQLHTKQ